MIRVPKLTYPFNAYTSRRL